MSDLEYLNCDIYDKWKVRVLSKKQSSENPEDFKIFYRFLYPFISGYYNGKWTHHPNDISKFPEQVQTFCKEKGLNTITLPVSKGDIIVWHPMLPHGGSPIKRKKSTRYSIVFHVVPNEMRVYGNDLFFEKEKFSSFSEPAPSIALSNSVFMQEQTCDFMDEGRPNMEANIISKSKKYLKNKIVKVKDKLKKILKK